MPPYDDLLFVPPAPVARVVLRHPERQQSIGDVPMLIDSVADATLLPRSAVTSLGLEGQGNAISSWGSTARSASPKRCTPIWPSYGGISGGGIS